MQCRCGCLPGIVSAPPAPQLIPRGKLGVSVWVQALLGKYLYSQPTHRLLQDWREQGLHVAQGTLTDGLKRLAPLFRPLAQAGLEHLRTHRHWHADETRWEVYVEREGKVGHRWYLWVFQAEDVVHFALDPSRSASVPTAVLAGVEDGILSVDRRLWQVRPRAGRHRTGLLLGAPAARLLEGGQRPSGAVGLGDGLG